MKGSDLASRHNPELMQAMWGPSLDPYEMVLTGMATSHFVVSDTQASNESLKSLSLSLSIRNQITKSIDEPKDSYQ